MITERSCSQSLLPLAVLLAFVLLQVLACGTNDSDGDAEEPPIDLTGSWELSTTAISNTCGLPNGETETEIVYLSPSDGELSITTFEGLWGSATLAGNEIHISGTETSDELGCPATLLTEGTGSVSGTEITGTLTATVSFNQDSCPGMPDCAITTDFVMTALEECSCLDRAVFGDPDSSDYVLPFPVDASYPVYQSYCFPAGGHRCQLAYDFTIPIGDPVVAARTGIVRRVREDSPDDGQGVGEHNYVFIEHEDGTTAFYAHLMQYSVIVSPDDTVMVGEQFALSGNSGYSGEPHLHFGVYEDYPPVEGNDLPIDFRNADGPLDTRGGLIRGEVYTATPS
jgi:hypothetical protein